jgi:nucleoid-associated protein YgaU
MATYVVQPGDSASLIAEKVAHDGHRWPELVVANPLKPTTSEGNFQSLRPGETLALPPTWPTPYAHASQVQP